MMQDKPLKIVGYGAYLRSIEEKDIQKIRVWRNQEEVRSKLFDSSIITEEDQIKWYRSLDSNKGRYFIFGREDAVEEDAGVMFIKNLEWKEPDESRGEKHITSCEYGVFIGDLARMSSTLIFRASILLYDYLFVALRVDLVYCWIMEINRESIRYNIAMGYEKVEDYCESSKYELTKKSYDSKTSSMKSFFRNGK